MMSKTILSHQQFVVFFLVVCSFVSFLFPLFFALPTKVILSAILFPIESPVASAVF